MQLHANSIGADLKSFDSILDSIEEKVSVLERVCDELDTWVKDLVGQMGSTR